MNTHDYTKGKTLLYAEIINDRLYFVTKKRYTEAKALLKWDVFKGYSVGTILHQAGCHNYMIERKLSDDVFQVKGYTPNAPHTYK